MHTTSGRDRYEVTFLITIISLFILLAVGAYLVNIALIKIASEEDKSSTPSQKIEIFV